MEEGGFLYDSDSYGDDLPYWNMDFGKPHLVLPYSLDTNDMRFVTSTGFNNEDFFNYLRDSVEFLLEVGCSVQGVGTCGSGAVCCGICVRAHYAVYYSFPCHEESSEGVSWCSGFLWVGGMPVDAVRWLVRKVSW